MPQWGISNEYPQHIFLWRNKKKYQHFWIEKSILSRAMALYYVCKVVMRWLLNNYTLAWLHGALRMVRCGEGVQLILAYSWARPAILVAGKGKGECFYFFCFFTFFPVPLSLLSLSFISSIISSIPFLPFSGRRYEMTHKGWRVVKPQHNQNSWCASDCRSKGPKFDTQLSHITFVEIVFVDAPLSENFGHCTRNIQIL